MLGSWHLAIHKWYLENDSINNDQVSKVVKKSSLLVFASTMEISYYILIFTFLYLLKNHFLRKFQNLPPSPFISLPIIDHLYLLKKKPLHKTLTNMSEKHGPLLYLRFGSRPVLLVSSPSLAEECFTKNDVVFANRPRLLAGKHLGYNYTTLLWASYGQHWRNQRRIAPTLAQPKKDCHSWNLVHSESSNVCWCSLKWGSHSASTTCKGNVKYRENGAILLILLIQKGELFVGVHIIYLRKTDNLSKENKIRKSLNISIYDCVKIVLCIL